LSLPSKARRSIFLYYYININHPSPILIMLISVVIPTYNNFAGLLRAISSISLQTGNLTFTYEIIIIDDASTDKKYHEHHFDENIIMIHLDQHIGQITTLCSIGIKQSCGDYIAFILDNDTWDMNKIDYQMYDMIYYNKTCSYWGQSISDLILRQGQTFPL